MRVHALYKGDAADMDRLESDRYCLDKIQSFGKILDNYSIDSN